MKDTELQCYFNTVKESSLFQSFYNGIDDIEEAGAIDKHQLRDVLDNNFKLSDQTSGVYLVRSGGSTQKPLVYPVDIHENLKQRELLAQELLAERIISSQTVFMNLFSYQDMYRTAAILDDILERCGATTLSLSSGSKNELICEAAMLYHPNMLAGTPSRLTKLAHYLQKKELTLRVDQLLYAGEFLLPSQKKLYEAVFHTKQIYSLYGSAETGIWGWSDYTKSPSVFRFLEDVVIEIDKADEDGFGRIIVTNLIRKRFPLFRYQVGDIGKVLVNGNQRTLYLKSREKKSFNIDAEAYFVNDFEELLKEFDQFQIQVSINDALTTVVTLLLIQPQIAIEEQESALVHVVSDVKGIISSDTENLNVIAKFVSEHELQFCETTSKTPQIVDLRI